MTTTGCERKQISHALSPSLFVCGFASLPRAQSVRLAAAQTHCRIGYRYLDGAGSGVDPPAASAVVTGDGLCAAADTPRSQRRRTKSVWPTPFWAVFTLKTIDLPGRLGTSIGSVDGGRVFSAGSFPCLLRCSARRCRSDTGLFVNHTSSERCRRRRDGAQRWRCCAC